MLVYVHYIMLTDIITCKVSRLKAIQLQPIIYGFITFSVRRPNTPTDCLGRTLCQDRRLPPLWRLSLHSTPPGTGTTSPRRGWRTTASVVPTAIIQQLCDSWWISMTAVYKYNSKMESRSTFVKRHAPEVAAAYRVPRSVVLRVFEWVQAPKLAEYRC